MLAEFASVLDAVVCALEIQQALARLDETDAERTMRFRIGINVGDVMVKDGDIFGDGVNVAARLESLAKGGGICVSRGVRDHLRHRTNLVFEDLGEQLVKNIAHPIRAFRLRLGDDNPTVLLGPSPNEGTAIDSALVSADNEVALELAFWESVKDGGADELLAYLERFPAGTFAALARIRQSDAESNLAEPMPVIPEPEEGPGAAELSFWDSIKESERADELNAYLDQYPDGHFTALAKARLSHTGEADGAALPSVTDAVELAFWEAIAESEDAKLFEAYQKYPEGEFAIIAKARIGKGPSHG